MVRINEANGCTCRAWSFADLDRTAVMALLKQEAAERDLDRKLIRAWNTQVEAGAPTTFSLTNFCDYLIDAYATYTAGRSI